MEKVEAKRILRDKAGHFLKGTLGASPGRRPLCEGTHLNKLLQAVSRVESRLNKNLLDYFIIRAFKSDQVLIALMKKLAPDLQAVALLVENEMSNESALAIQKKLAERFQ